MSLFLIELTTLTSITGGIGACVEFVPHNLSLCSMYIFRGGTGDEISNSLRLHNIKEYVVHEADGHCGKRHRPRMLYHDLLRLVLELIDDPPGEDIKPK